MKAYFNYMIKTKWLQTLIMAIITSFIFIIVLAVFSSEINSNLGSSIRYPSVFGFGGILMFGVSMVIAIFRFAPLRNEREVDLYYGLPISRKKLYFTHYLIGLIQIGIIGFILYFLGIIEFTILSQGRYNEGYIILILPMTLFYVAIVYTLWSYIFIKANTILDGIVFVILFNLLLVFISMFLMRLNDYQFVDRLSFTISPYYGQSMLSRILLAKAANAHEEIIFEIFDIFFIPINTLGYVILSGLAILHVNNTVQKEKVEYIGDLSSSRFGYVTMIPLIIFFGVIGTDFFGVITFFFKAMFLIAGFIGFFIYRRGIKIKLKDVALILIPWIMAWIVTLFIR